MESKPFRLSVKVLLRNVAEQVLLLRRSAASKHNAGKWDFPGGKVDAGERFDEALVREVREETGLSMCLERVLGAGESVLPDHVVAYLFLGGRLLDGEVRLSDEHDAFQWLSKSDLLEHDIAPQFRPFAEQCARR